MENKPHLKRIYKSWEFIQDEDVVRADSDYMLGRRCFINWIWNRHPVSQEGVSSGQILTVSLNDAQVLEYHSGY